MPEQNFKNHTRVDPAHALALFFALFFFIGTIVALFHHTNLLRFSLLSGSIALILVVLRSRSYALGNQDRIIRLEERLRLGLLMPGDSTTIAALSTGQLVGLRFASDAEAPELARRAVRENLTAKQIKAAIQQWRPDHKRA